MCCGNVDSQLMASFNISLFSDMSFSPSWMFELNHRFFAQYSRSLWQPAYNIWFSLFYFQEEAKYMMHLTINRISDSDEGDYFCHAENAFGSSTQPVSVRIRNVVSSTWPFASTENNISIALCGGDMVSPTLRNADKF